MEGLKLQVKPMKLSMASKCGTFAFLWPSPFFEVELMVLFKQNFTKPRSNLASLTKGAPAFSTVVGSHVLEPLLVTAHFCSIFTATCSSPDSPSDGLEPRADICAQCEPQGTCTQATSLNKKALQPLSQWLQTRTPTQIHHCLTFKSQVGHAHHLFACQLKV